MIKLRLLVTILLFLTCIDLARNQTWAQQPLDGPGRVFHDELRRIIPGDHPYDDDWLKEVDAKLLLAPVESFEDACKGSMISASRPLSADFGSKPLPDVPVDFDDAEDDSGTSMEAWEWVCSLSRYQMGYLLTKYLGISFSYASITCILSILRRILSQISASTNRR